MVQASLAAQSSRSGPDAVFEQRAREVWLESFDAAPGSSGDTLPIAIARLAGLEFQAKTDRLTPDLDSALALAVMSGGKLRNTPWGWFAYSRRLQQSRGSCLPYSETTAGQWFSYCRRVADSYRQALKRDSLFPPVLADLDRAIPWPQLWLEPDAEVAMLRGALQDRELPPRLHRRLERRYLNIWIDSDTSITPAMFRASGADTAFTRGEFLLQLSRVVARNSAGLEGQRLHALAAADTGTGEHPQWIRTDVERTGTPEELAEWDSLPPAGRREWLDEFWGHRDFEAGMEPGRRYAEHARRLQFAYREYRNLYDDVRLRGTGAFASQDRPCPLEEADSSAAAMLVVGCNLPDSVRRAMIFDDRGLAYIRHGEPAQRVRYPGMQYFSTESWIYFRPDGPLVLHFAGKPPPLDFHGMVATPVARGDWMTACKLDAVYCGLAAAVSTGGVSAHRMSTLAERGRKDIERMATTDGAVQWFREPLRFNAGAYGLGRRAGMATLAVDIPLTSLRKLAGSNRNRATLRWQVRIRGADGSWPVSSDSVLPVNLPDGGADRDRYITLVRQFTLPPGTYSVRLVLSDPAGATGAMYARDAMVIVGGDDPNLSDLVLIPDGGQGTVRQFEGETVHLSPTFTAGSAGFLQVGYLLTGFAGLDVRVSVEITPVDREDDKATGLAVEFTDHPERDRSFFTKRIGVEQLRSGHYDLSVSVLLPDGTTARRTQRMVVRK